MEEGRRTVFWFEHDVRFRKSMSRLLTHYAQPLAPLVIRGFEPTPQKLAILGRARPDLVILNYEDGAIKILGAAPRRLRALVFSEEELSLTTIARLDELGGIVRRKDVACRDVKDLACGIVELTQLRLLRPRPLARTKPLHERILDDIDRTGEPYTHHRDQLDRLAIERALATRKTLSAASIKTGFKLTTLRSKLAKLGLEPPARPPARPRKS